MFLLSCIMVNTDAAMHAGRDPVQKYTKSKESRNDEKLDFFACCSQDYKTLYATMKRIADAEPRELDTWKITMSAGQ